MNEQEPAGQGDELDRTLGFTNALSIGTGTMIGAGVFVFPGLAAGRAGAAASVSFALGAAIALLVALPASELATAMPRSGGAYFFVSRGLGALAGSVAGIGQWTGLIFASAFYLVGFGHYFARALDALGGGMQVPVVALALAAALGLTAVNVVGTRHAGSLQSLVVAVLLALLGVIMVYGGYRMATDTAVSLPEQFAPHGTLAVFRTAALVFTSYLGFLQIAAVGGEVKEPHRNIPLSIVASVLLVAGVYVVVMLISTSVLSVDRLREFGETAFVAVARNLLGPAGAVAVLLAGLLATFSSANASILGSSRSAYALSRDDLMPDEVSRVNRRFGTPHVSLLATGIPIAALTLAGRVEILAEVASFLHLVIYGLLCIGLIVLRRSPPGWYDPSFRSPGYPVVPAAGAAACFGLIAFMNPLSWLIGLTVVCGAALWHFYYGRDVKLRGAEA